MSNSIRRDMPLDQYLQSLKHDCAKSKCRGYDMTAIQNPISQEKADSLDISRAAQLATLQIKEHGDVTLKLDEDFFSPDAVENRKRDLAEAITNPEEVDPLTDDFALHCVRYTHREGTIEGFIGKSLEGKVLNPSLIAEEIGKMIRGTISNKSATVEQRAIDRENGLYISGKLADFCFDNAAAHKSFMDEITRFAKNDELREKGYIVDDDGAFEPYKSYLLMPGVPDDVISGTAWAREFGVSSMREIFENKDLFEAFQADLKVNHVEWKNNIIKNFNANEKQVTEIIKRVGNQFNAKGADSVLRRIFNAV